MYKIVPIAFLLVFFVIIAILYNGSSEKIPEFVSDPCAGTIRQQSQPVEFQPDSTFVVVDLEPISGTYLVRGVVERADGQKFSVLLVDRGDLYLSRMINIEVGDTVKLIEVTYLPNDQNDPPNGFGSSERFLVVKQL